MRFGKGKRIQWLAAGAAAIACGVVAWGGRRQTSQNDMPLPTGRFLAPEGKQTDIGSFPVNLLLSPDGKYVVVTEAGFREHLSVLSAEDGRLVSQLAFNAVRPGEQKAKQALYVGLAFAPTSGDTHTLYVSRGPEDRVSVFTLDADGQLKDTGRSLNNPSPLPKSAKDSAPNFIAGIALSANGARLYAVNNMTSAFTNQQGSVSILDTRRNQILGKVATPGFPYAIATLTQGEKADTKAYVTSERDGVVSVLDVSDPVAPSVTRSVATGDHPMALLLDKAQKRLFVANAGSDTVSVIDTDTDAVAKTYVVRPAEARGLPGATPTGLALSPDESRLYVTLGDMNAVAVLDLQNDGALTGFVPTGWYPTSAVVNRDGTRLFVANAKGVLPRHPNDRNAGPKGEWGQYIQNIIEGTVSLIPVPGPEEIHLLTGQVLAYNRLMPALSPDPPSPAESGLPSGIKHVLYIIKENRTYDQVLGDLKQGNGDPSLALFGRRVTPNLHALAERFVLLDNFYCCSEVSADGWNWSTSGMASEYTVRNAPFNYSGRGRSYDFEGQNNGTPADIVGLPDVARAPGGYLWDQCLKNNVSFHNYGFFVAGSDDDKGTDDKPFMASNTPTKKALVGRTDTSFLQFDMAYADSDAWQVYNCPAPKQRRFFGQFKAPSRFAEWRREFDQYVKKGTLPTFLMVRFPRDHTSGTKAGLQSPRGMVADNDYAVGQLVEAVSKTHYWKETAIFILEDDAQNGHDHVDAHRSIAFVISPYIASGTVDHRFYNTDSMLRTLEALLGLPPMCQYDAAAPLMKVFGPRPVNAAPYRSILPPRAIIGEFNRQTAYRARDSERLDFRGEDRVPDAVLNDILWHAVKGVNVPEPSPRHSLRLSAARPDRDD
jgi:YVTN family beta-propeller protein